MTEVRARTEQVLTIEVSQGDALILMRALSQYAHSLHDEEPETSITWGLAQKIAAVLAKELTW